jgi:hypothetical protein
MRVGCADIFRCRLNRVEESRFGLQGKILCEVVLYRRNNGLKWQKNIDVMIDYQ